MPRIDQIRPNDYPVDGTRAEQLAFRAGQAGCLLLFALSGLLMVLLLIVIGRAVWWLATNHPEVALTVALAVALVALARTWAYGSRR